MSDAPVNPPHALGVGELRLWVYIVRTRRFEVAMGAPFVDYSISVDRANYILQRRRCPPSPAGPRRSTSNQLLIWLYPLLTRGSHVRSAIYTPYWGPVGYRPIISDYPYFQKSNSDYRRPMIGRAGVIY